MLEHIAKVDMTSPIDHDRERRRRALEVAFAAGMEMFRRLQERNPLRPLHGLIREDTEALPVPGSAREHFEAMMTAAENAKGDATPEQVAFVAEHLAGSPSSSSAPHSLGWVNAFSPSQLIAWAIGERLTASLAFLKAWAKRQRRRLAGVVILGGVVFYLLRRRRS